MVRSRALALYLLPAVLATEVASAENPPPTGAETPNEPSTPAPTPAPLPAHWFGQNAEPKAATAAGVEKASPPPKHAPTKPPPTKPAPIAVAPQRSKIDTAANNEPEEAGLRLAIEPLIGFSARLGAAALDFSSEETAGAVYGVNVGLTPNRRYSRGLGFDRSLLGAGRTNQGADTISIEYGANTLSAWTRAFPWHDGKAGLYVGLRLGLSWQDLEANGSRATNEPSRPVEVFQCTGADSPSLALAAALGVEVAIERHIGFIAEGTATGYQASSAVIDGCAPGIGSTTGVGARIGLQVLLDVGDG